MDHRILVLVLGTLTFLMTVRYSFSCNELVCASIVSKCMLTQSCKCDLKNCTCCKDCFNCLSYLYSECCSCVDLCPKPNDTRNALSKKSHVEELEGIEGLFNALTVEPDIEEKWSIFSFPIDFDSAMHGAKMDKDVKYMTHSSDQDLETNKYRENKNVVTLNCTVAYMAQCMSWNKCRESCSSMGAYSYRWFHVGCCECVGKTCINYGINDSRCLDCPEMKIGDGSNNSLDGSPNEDDLDYGDSMKNIESI